MAWIVIAGHGYVGGAVASVLSTTNSLSICDPLINDNRVYDYPDADGVILCLPTPEREDGSCDTSFIDSVLKDCYDHIPILIKSTMSIEGYRALVEKHPNLPIAYSPEFLTAANANKDFAEQNYYYIAGDCLDFWVKVFKEALPNSTPKISSTVEELILVKYFRNSFLSVKVAYANQMYDVCKAMGIPYENIRSKFVEDDRIGSSHTAVPGPDGTRGFGGACFPKDTAAILHTAQTYDWDLSIIDASVQYNNKVRK